MARRPFIMLVLLAALLAGCAADPAAETSGAEDAESPAAAAAAPSAGTSDATCEELADELVTQLETIARSIAEMSPAEIAEDDQIQDAEQRIDEVSQQVEDSGCQEQVEEIVSTRVDALESEGTSSEFLRELLESSNLGGGS